MDDLTFFKLKKYKIFLPIGNSLELPRILSEVNIHTYQSLFNTLTCNIKFVTYLLYSDNFQEKLEFIFNPRRLSFHSKVRPYYITQFNKIKDNYILNGNGYSDVLFHKDFSYKKDIHEQTPFVKGRYRKKIICFNENLRTNKEKILISLTDGVKVEDYQLLGDRLVKRGIKDFDFLVIAPLSKDYKYYEEVDNTVFRNIGGDYYNIFILKYKKLETLHRSLRFLFRNSRRN